MPYSYTDLFLVHFTYLDNVYLKHEYNINGPQLVILGLKVKNYTEFAGLLVGLKPNGKKLS